MAAIAEVQDLAYRELGRGELGRARDLFAQVRERVLREGWTGFLPAVEVAAAALASAEGDHGRATRLAAVAEEAFTRCGQTPDPEEQSRIAAVRAAALRALGPDGFTAAQQP